MDLIYLAHPVRPLPGSTETVESNLAGAEWWFAALQRANPDVAFTMDWDLELRLKVGRDEIPEDRSVGLARACARAARCTGIALCGPRISSGKLDELAAYRNGQPAPWTIHRFSRRDQPLDLGQARTQASVHRAPTWLRWAWFGAFPQSAELVAQEILDAERREAEVRK